MADIGGELSDLLPNLCLDQIPTVIIEHFLSAGALSRDADDEDDTNSTQALALVVSDPTVLEAVESLARILRSSPSADARNSDSQSSVFPEVMSTLGLSTHALMVLLYAIMDAHAGTMIRGEEGKEFDRFPRASVLCYLMLVPHVPSIFHPVVMRSAVTRLAAMSRERSRNVGNKGKGKRTTKKCQRQPRAVVGGTGEAGLSDEEECTQGSNLQAQSQNSVDGGDTDSYVRQFLSALQATFLNINLSDSDDLAAQLVDLLVSLARDSLYLGVSPSAGKPHPLPLLRQMVTLGAGSRGSLLQIVFKAFLPILSLCPSTATGAPMKPPPGPPAKHLLLAKNSGLEFLENLAKEFPEEHTYKCIQALCQHLCLRSGGGTSSNSSVTPAPTDTRRHVADTIRNLLSLFPSASSSGDVEENDGASGVVQFVRFLRQFACSSRIGYRLMALDVIAALLERPTDSHGDFREIRSLVSVLATHVTDKAPTVRARAIGALAACLSSNSADDIIRDFLLSHSTCADTEGQAPSSQPDILTVVRSRVVDEKPLVRKAAVQILHHIASLQPSVDEDDVMLLRERCVDLALAVRKEAVLGVNRLLLRHPSHASLQNAWLDAVLPLMTDVEASLQTLCTEKVEEVLLSSVCANGEATSGHRRLPVEVAWRLLDKAAASHALLRHMRRILAVLGRAGKLSRSPLVCAILNRIHPGQPCPASVDPLSPSITHAAARLSECATGVVIPDGNTALPAESQEECQAGAGDTATGLCVGELGGWMLVSQVAAWAKNNPPLTPPQLLEAWQSLKIKSEAGEIQAGFVLSTISTLANQVFSGDHSESDRMLLETFLEELTKQLATVRFCSPVLQRMLTAVKVLHDCLTHAPTSTSTPPTTAHSTASPAEESTETPTKSSDTAPEGSRKRRRSPRQSDVVAGSHNGSSSRGATEYQARVLGCCVDGLKNYLREAEDAAKGVSQVSDEPDVNADASHEGVHAKPGRNVVSVDCACRFAFVAGEAALVWRPATSSLTPLHTALLACVGSAAAGVSVRAHAIVALGKLCLNDAKLARRCTPLFIRDLDASADPVLRNNVLLVLSDLCRRHTQLVEPAVPMMARCLRASTATLRRHALSVFTALIGSDFLKWKGSLFYRLAASLADEDPAIRTFALYCLRDVLLIKQPLLFSTHFLESLFVFNDVQGHPVFARFSQTKEDRELFSLAGSQNREARMLVYRVLLRSLTDEQKFHVTCRLCHDVLGAVLEETVNLADTHDVVADTLYVLAMPEIKIGASKSTDADRVGLEGEEDITAGMASAKNKLLSEIVRKNAVENIVPTVIGLKRLLAKRRSPLMGLLMTWLRELLKDYRDEISDILVADKQLAKEIEYDLRQADLQQQADGVGSPEGAAGLPAASPQPRTPTASARTPGATATHTRTPATRTPTAHSPAASAAGTPRASGQKAGKPLGRSPLAGNEHNDATPGKNVTPPSTTSRSSSRKKGSARGGNRTPGSDVMSPNVTEPATGDDATDPMASPCAKPLIRRVLADVAPNTPVKSPKLLKITRGGAVSPGSKTSLHKENQPDTPSPSSRQPSKRMRRTSPLQNKTKTKTKKSTQKAIPF